MQNMLACFLYHPFQAHRFTHMQTGVGGQEVKTAAEQRLAGKVGAEKEAPNRLSRLPG
jgi:hypothetical protein